ncbi:MAG TPA: response regulator [Tepidisphaeraceae bacterium]|jgi:DNA-binding response OmpR family regulator|nr:response regulator [Tepidisphaeraceae bacterium]
MARTALIVEDDEMLADLLATVLRSMDFNPVVFHYGANAPDWVREHRPDLVLLDLMLPDCSGYDICEKIKLDRETNLTPVIIATALTDHSQMVRGLRVGANYYLTKPFNIDQLQYAVDHVLKKRDELIEGGASGEIHFVLKSDSRYLAELNDMMSSLLLFSGLSDDQAYQLSAAVREMGNNAIEWGNRKQIDQPVSVTYRIEKNQIVIRIRDNGSGFDRANLPHAAKPDDPAAHMSIREEKGLRVGGFGIFMTRGLVDELEYNEAGNEVRLIKRFTPKAAVAS